MLINGRVSLTPLYKPASRMCPLFLVELIKACSSILGHLLIDNMKGQALKVGSLCPCHISGRVRFPGQENRLHEKLLTLSCRIQKGRDVKGCLRQGAIVWTCYPDCLYCSISSTSVLCNANSAVQKIPASCLIQRRGKLQGNVK